MPQEARNRKEVVVEAEGIEDDDQLKAWIGRAWEFGKDYLQAGQVLPPKDAPEELQGLTLLDLINHFMDAKTIRVDAGKMTERQTWARGLQW